MCISDGIACETKISRLAVPKFWFNAVTRYVLYLLTYLWTYKKRSPLTWLSIECWRDQRIRVFFQIGWLRTSDSVETWTMIEHCRLWSLVIALRDQPSASGNRECLLRKVARMLWEQMPSRKKVRLPCSNFICFGLSICITYPTNFERRFKWFHQSILSRRFDDFFERKVSLP